MSDAESIYNLKGILEREIAKLSLDSNNGTVLLRYYKSRIAEGLSLARLVKCISTLRLLSQMLRKPFDQANKEDLVDLIAEIERKDFAEWTKHDYKVILKRFYKWLRNCEDGEYPPEVRWIRASSNISNRLQKKDLLTAEEIEKIVAATVHIRDRAFISVYFESMRRLGEILTLKVGNIEFDQLGARLSVEGKMGSANARVIASAPLLATWLNTHPQRNDPRAPVWITLHGKAKQMSYSTMRSMLNDCVRKAGISKRVWPYLIRHSRITPASKLLSYSLLCSTAGWKQGSKMPAVYIHLASEDIDEAQCILNGVRKPEQSEEQFRPKICTRCKSNNSPDSKFCNYCGMPLDMETATKIDEARGRIDSALNRLTEDPKKLEKLLSLIEQ